MTTVVVVLATVVLLLAAVVGYVGWRDRRRAAADEDREATGAARAEWHRRAAEREHEYGDGWNRDGQGYSG
ncbi:hypothetical protein Q2K19_24275 [Micromonospora soli]|uniref:hypothetical protein n=1 Tax=Micromonospora sp. NBRC 110009 TaxID=3061627 RepID=UPI0026725390|nr:hypothetical protein [Micromonospora sp. NBRC 110009]WKT97268.1 hypothetical protein Q2K19_24275 [Micromonospora sp. NBRC 110009]